METREIFECGGQGHVFEHWHELNERQRVALLEQAQEIDLAELDRLVETLVKGKGEGEQLDFERLEPAPYEAIPENLERSGKWQGAKQRGEEALRAGRVGAFTVAGGQGTRLGYDGPKGTFPVTPIKEKSLFQVFAEKIEAARRDYGAAIPWYVMTSHINHTATEAYFKEMKFFGLEPDSVRFFRQGRMPAVDFKGRIILESKDSIAMSPDGHGGALRALDRSGSLEEMKAAGIDILSYFQVDNPLVQIIDPYFIGFHLESGSQLSSKMLPKAYEKEKLGHFCRLDGKMRVVEYSDMPDELTAQRDESGRLRFLAGSIAIHLMSVPFIQSLAKAGSEATLPFHKAEKKIPFLAEDGSTDNPGEPNGVKFELFVFDALPFAEKAVVMETTRLGDFSPVKNAEGVDSPESCRSDQQKLFARWLWAEGVSVPLDEEGVPEHPLEISSLYGYNSDSFAASWKQAPRPIDSQGENYIE